MIRAVLDANVVISGSIAPLGFSAAILLAWPGEYFEVVTCPSLLAEVDEKLHLPRIRKKYSIRDEDVTNLLLHFSRAAHLVPGLALADPPPPDRKDSILFSAASESDADYIVTGDKPLLSFVWNGRARIVSPRQFWQEELPRDVIRALSYPVFAFEDITGTGAHAVEVEQGESCVALFTTQEAAELFRRKRNILAEVLTFEDARLLTVWLKKLAASDREKVALNPTEQFCFIESMELVLKALEQASDSPG